MAIFHLRKIAWVAVAYSTEVVLETKQAMQVSEVHPGKPLSQVIEGIGPMIRPLLYH
jgi:hypothetical protein